LSAKLFPAAHGPISPQADVSLLAFPANRAAAAAYQICTGHRSVVTVATLFGMLSALVGLVVAFYLNLRTGACIVLVSAAILALAALYRAIRGRQDYRRLILGLFCKRAEEKGNIFSLFP
jgi:type IV secretory pathway TrbD component